MKEQLEEWIEKEPSEMHKPTENFKTCVEEKLFNFYMAKVKENQNKVLNDNQENEVIINEALK